MTEPNDILDVVFGEPEPVSDEELYRWIPINSGTNYLGEDLQEQDQLRRERLGDLALEYGLTPLP